MTVSPPGVDTETGPAEASLRPRIPLGRRVALPDRGTTFVREVPGPAGAPALILFHGWVASGGLNWFRVFEPLGRFFRVLAVDLRGHARGLRTRRVFRIADCADDAAVLLDELGTGPAIAVGYSLGGPVAQLFWRRHRDLCEGLVLCATTHDFVPGTRERVVIAAGLTAAVGASRLADLTTRLPFGPLGPLAVIPTPANSRGPLPAWAAAELRRHDWRMIVEAGHSIATYGAARWIGEVDVPTACVVTTRDSGVPPALQYATADAIDGASVHTVEDGHLACARPSFAVPLLDACLDVAARAGSGVLDLGAAPH